MSARTGLLKALDSALGPAFCAVLSRAQREPESRTLRDFPGGRVLVVRPGGIGDAVLLLPALRALRQAMPDSSVDVLCESRNAPVFELSGLADRVLRADAAPLASLRALRRGRYAAVLDTEQFHHFSAVLAARTRAPLRVGFSVAPARLGLYTHTVPYDQQDPEDALFAPLARRGVVRTTRADSVSAPLPSQEAVETIERRILESIGKQLVQRVRVNPPARHVLGTREVSTLNDEHRLPGTCELDGRAGARKTGAHDNRIEIRHHTLLSQQSGAGVGATCDPTAPHTPFAQ